MESDMILLVLFNSQLCLCSTDMEATKDSHFVAMETRIWLYNNNNNNNDVI